MKDSKLSKISFIAYPKHTFINSNGIEEEGGIDIEYCLSLIRDKICSYAYILHDKDIIEDSGELKKPHYHIILLFHKQEHTKPILKLFKTNVYETIKNLNGCIQYLVHKGYDNKYQYKIEDVVFRNLDVPTIINSFVVKNDFESGLQILFEYLPKCNDIIDIVNFAIKNSLYSVLKANYNIIKDYYKCYCERKSRLDSLKKKNNDFLFSTTINEILNEKEDSN